MTQSFNKQQAACILGISRPTLDKALQEGRATLNPPSYTPAKRGKPFTKAYAPRPERTKRDA